LEFKESSANTVNTVLHSIEGLVPNGVGVQIPPVAPPTYILKTPKKYELPRA